MIPERTSKVRKVIGAVAALQLTVLLTLPAQAGGVAALFPTQPTGMVTDVANIIDGSVRAQIEARLVRLRELTGAEVAVVTLPTINDRAPVEVAVAIGRAWGVGAKAAIGSAQRNAGVVMLLVPRTAEHKGEIFIASGTGTEGFVTDARSGAIADQMLPALRQGDYGAAVNLGTSVLADLIAREMGVQDSALVKRPREQARRFPWQSLMPILFGIFWLILVSRGRRGGGGGGGGGGNSWIVPFLIGQAMGGGRRDWGGGGGFGGGGFGGFGGGGGFSGGGGGRSF